METAYLGVMIDSSIAIEGERQQLNANQFLRRISQRLGEIEAALCAITVAELVHGIHRANTPERRDRRRRFVDELRAALPVYSVGEATAELIGKIGGESAARGSIIPFDDLLIGCCALERVFAIATRNLRHFQKIPGLGIIEL